MQDYRDLLSIDFGKKLIETFRKCADIGESGFIAGGAVANVIISMVHGINAPINDIDVFKLSGGNDFVWILSKNCESRFTESRLECDWYGELSLYSKSYTVVGSKRSGLLNVVEVATFDLVALNETIIKGFDLNCTMVGVDIETGEVLYRPEFIEFLNTRELKVHGVHTPYRTALRLLKKKKELGCYCNVDEQLRYLSQVPLVLEKSPKADPDYSPLHKRLKMDGYPLYTEYKDIIDRYFTVSELEDDFFAMRPALVDEEIQQKLQGCANISEIQCRWKLVQGRKAEINRNMQVLKQEGCLRDFIYSNPNYAKCDFHIKHLSKINKFLESHPRIGIIFAEMKLNVNQQVAAIRTLEKAVKKHGHYVIGLVENAEIPDEINYEWISELIEKHKGEYLGSLKSIEDLSGFIYNGYAKELVTAAELIEEGHIMKHCVGGYAKRVRDGYCTVFHIETSEGMSTIELSGRNPMRINQHKGKLNSKPCLRHLVIGELLCEYLNKEQPDPVRMRMSLIKANLSPWVKLKEDEELSDVEIMREERKELEWEEEALCLFMGNRVEAFDDMKYIRAERNRQN